MSLVMFDIDHFKNINDNYGHLAGDQVLKTMALTIKSKIRREDLFARYGGEEFSIVLPEIDGYNAHQFAEKVRRIVEATDFLFEGTKMPVTISMGVATLDADTADAAALIKRADERLYEAKGAGRNCVRG
jgi:diguanylate cyclase (GGDEF)-like protein